MQLRCVCRGVEGIAVPQHEPQMREKIAWEQSYDLQFRTRVKICRENRVFCHKMPVYATYRDPTFGKVVRPNRYTPELESPMSRRQLTLVVLTLAASLVATACGTSPTAPKHDASIVTMGGTG
jgi:hypothetical protein